MTGKKIHLLIILFLCHTFSVFAQSDELGKKLTTTKNNNDLSTWIYEQLDAAEAQKSSALPILQAITKNAWRKAQTPNEHYAWLNLLNTLGYHQLLAGNILASIDYYEQAFSYYTQYKINSYDVVAYTLKPLANNYTRLGDYERAIFLQQKSVEILQTNNAASAEIAAIYSNMAIAYRSMEHLDKARLTINNALALKLTGTASVMANNVLADILFDEANYKEALRIILQNIKVQKHINKENAYWLMSSYSTAGNIYLATKQSELATKAFKKSLNLLDQYYPSARVRERANLYTQLGKTALLQEQNTLAKNYFHQTLQVLRIADKNYQINEKRIYGDNKLVDVFTQLALTSKGASRELDALKYLAYSLKSADLIRAEFASDKTKERLQQSIKNIIEEAIAVNYQLYSQTKNKKYLTEILELTEQSKARTLLDQIQRNQNALLRNNKADSLFIKKQNLESAITYQEKLVIESADANTKIIDGLIFDLALINKAIAQKYPRQKTAEAKIDLKKLPNHYFITYFFGQNDLYAVVINQHQIERVIKIANANYLRFKLSHYVETYFQNGPTAMLNSPIAFYKSAFQIYSDFVLPLKLKPGKAITIIPDGWLGYLSFDGLVGGTKFEENIAKWPFLIKKHSINYAFSLSTLQTKRAEQNSDSFAGLFVSHSDNNNAALRGVNAEAENIKQFVKGDFYINDAAKPAIFGSLFTRTSVIHVGTHAYLSGPNDEPTLDFGKEKLYLFELAAKKTAPSLVVLSACKTADGQLANGEGIISLSRGFSAIGTQATIASLWNVNDDAAATISANFYRFLNAKTSAAAALRNAKLDWLGSKQSNTAMLLPYYWDSMVYMGNDQFIALPAPTNWKLWRIIIGAGILLLAFFSFREKKDRQSR